MGRNSGELDVLAQRFIMKFIFFIFILLVQTRVTFAVTEIFLQMKPDQRYMGFVLKKYLQWHNQYFPGRFEEMNNRTNGSIKKFLEHIDHWVVAGYPELPQFSIGHEAGSSSEILLTYRIYIAPSLREDPFFRNLLPESKLIPWFVEWRSDLSLCILTLDKDMAPIGFDVYCGGPGAKKLNRVGKEKLFQDNLSPWPNPFPYLLGREVRRYKEDKLIQIRYFSDATHPSRSDRRLDHVIHLHGIEALFPFDKFGVGADGKITVYYP